MVNDKKKFLIKLRLIFPNLSIDEIDRKLNGDKYFRIKTRITQSEKQKLWSLGEKAIKFEPFQARVYTHGNLFSHIVGQVDYDNYGISGIEKYLDKELKNKKLINNPIELTLDSNIQYIINKELEVAIETFNASGAAALLMDVNNGDILSLVSLLILILINVKKLKTKNSLIKLQKEFMSWALFLKLLHCSTSS